MSGRVRSGRSGQDGLGAAFNDFLEFENNMLLPVLYGECDRHLSRLEEQLGVKLASRGNRVSISGSSEGEVSTARVVLNALYERLEKGLEVTPREVDAVLRAAAARPAFDNQGREQATEATHSDELTVVTRKRRLNPFSPRQAAYLKALRQRELVFGIGPAGTGKTYLAVAFGASLMLQGKVERIVLSRPAVEAGERLGFLPGDMKDKVDPYLRPLYDALYDMIPAEQVNRRLASGEIEIAPLAFMRGRTLSNAFIILDEAQNTTAVQMKMFLTRLGAGSRMVITGDLSQIDLPKGQLSGLKDAAEALAHMDEVGFVEFTSSDIVRHALVTKIVHAYDERERGARGHRDFSNGQAKADSF